MFIRSKKTSSAAAAPGVDAGPKVTIDDVMVAAKRVGVEVYRMGPTWKWWIKLAEGGKQLLAATNLLAKEALDQMPAKGTVKKLRKLKVWSGPSFGAIPLSEMQSRGLAPTDPVHVYACAHSRAALVRMIEAYQGVKHVHGMGYRIKTHWSVGWGAPMAGVVPEAGIWAQFGMDLKPERVWSE